MKLVNFYSTVWFFYNDDNFKIEKDVFLGNISKIKNMHNIKNIINLDKEFKFWDTNESVYNSVIATQVILDKQKKCLLIIKKLCKIINDSIMHNINILFISYKKLELLICLMIYFLNKYGMIKLDKCLITINSKIKLPSNYSINSNLKKILILECNK